MQALDNIIKRAKASPKRIVLSEGFDSRVIQAAARIHKEGIADPILLGESEQIMRRAERVGVDISHIEIINPANSDMLMEFGETVYQMRKSKGVDRKQANELAKTPLWFGNLLVKSGYADGSVAGAVHSTANVVRTAIRAIGVRPDAKMVSSFFLMVFDQPHHEILKGSVLFADCALIIDPTAEQMTEIALATANNARRLLEEEPRVAMLSFSTSGSARNPKVSKVQQATEMVKDRDATIKVDGEVQFHAAVLPKVAKHKVIDTQVEGRSNVFVFPSLEAGNIAYKMLQLAGGAKAIGPFLQGLNKPANDLPRSCSVDDIYYTIATTAVQANR
uniref:Phosphate acetyltransferase n=1 Tax=uncultured Thiotrichaceae bacterium TaxID=298394 RepID=A0A6S6UKU9_9GAMM|nr:MAG: Phosphate acetyltransferase (EC [uncultured Thiotrichaceae bacterium]